LPIAYIRDAAQGIAPKSRADQVDYATVLRLPDAELSAAVGVLEEWAATPSF
jgi:hypothetical protein